MILKTIAHVMYSFIFIPTELEDEKRLKYKYINEEINK